MQNSLKWQSQWQSQVVLLTSSWNSQSSARVYQHPFQLADGKLRNNKAIWSLMWMLPHNS